jgi:hypothetical protein
MHHTPEPSGQAEIWPLPYRSRTFAFIRGVPSQAIMDAFCDAFERAWEEALAGTGAYIDPMPGEGAWEAWIVIRQYR